MKKIKIVFVLIMCALIIVTLFKFNFESPSISEIDNRYLSELDFDKGADRTQVIDEYIKDRVGYRSFAINSFSYLNDLLFNQLEHPTYTYGEDGHVFFRLSREYVDTQFLDQFCMYLKKVQTYCEERNVPFIYCLNPSKVSVYSEYLPEGYVYKNAFINTYEEKLEEYGINYISNYGLLKEKSASEQVYNIKYDAGHWNDLGAFYGTNNILRKVHEYFPEVRENTLDDFEITQELQTTLPVSYFKIKEYTPLFTLKETGNVEYVNGWYSTLKRDERHMALATSINKEDLPNVLFFQGSYLNSRRKYFDERFGMYTSVHNYENFLNFEYYFNVIKPDCVILETADYATGTSFFDMSTVENYELNPVLNVEKRQQAHSLGEFTYKKDIQNRLVILEFDIDQVYQRGYLVVGNESYDILVDKQSGKYTCTLDTNNFDERKAKVFFE